MCRKKNDEDDDEHDYKSNANEYKCHLLVSPPVTSADLSTSLLKISGLSRK